MKKKSKKDSKTFGGLGKKSYLCTRNSAMKPFITPLATITMVP